MDYQGAQEVLWALRRGDAEQTPVRLLFGAGMASNMSLGRAQTRQCFFGLGQG